MDQDNQRQSSWIVSRPYDLFFFIGSSLTSYLVLYLHFGLGLSVALLFWAWIIFFDGPHLFATFTRTYLDRQAWLQHSRLFKLSTIILLSPLLVVATSFITGSTIAFVLFILIYTLYQWWHVVRQHYGIMVLYQKKYGELVGYNNKLDYWFLHLVMFTPYASVICQNENLAQRLPIVSDYVRLYWAAPILNTLTLSIIFFYFTIITIRFVIHRKINLQKMLFLCVVIPLPLVISMSNIAVNSSYLLLAAATTIYHNLQYQGIVWFYSKNRYQQNNSKATLDYGLANFLTKSIYFYYAAAITLSILLYYTVWLMTDSLNYPFVGFLKNYFIQHNSLILNDLFLLIPVAISIHHFYLDQHIWRVSKNLDVNKNLKLSSANTFTETT